MFKRKLKRPESTSFPENDIDQLPAAPFYFLCFVANVPSISRYNLRVDPVQNRLSFPTIRSFPRSDGDAPEADPGEKSTTGTV